MLVHERISCAVFDSTVKMQKRVRKTRSKLRADESEQKTKGVIAQKAQLNSMTEHHHCTHNTVSSSAATAKKLSILDVACTRTGSDHAL